MARVKFHLCSSHLISSLLCSAPQPIQLQSAGTRRVHCPFRRRVQYLEDRDNTLRTCARPYGPHPWTTTSVFWILVDHDCIKHSFLFATKHSR
ncbi:hypothetical protein EJ02DRAFT_163310 [Clathrospora elynae]|uniref:Uncharacterized protein n=1 Tax=Clathrospora elynae TaxID=706981 RepID=A0A6A5SPS0_9PLEO|nr:hypothetical protein EJ02DRAFT_163310 [Clathrospora elynae]